MKIAVISDSHNSRDSINNIKQYINEADAILHCGDGVTDLNYLEDIFNGDIYGVRGNCDISELYPIERIVELGNKKILICHGHLYKVKMEYNNLFYRAKELGVDIVVFGHSHLAVILKHDGIVMMNPGSISLPHMGKSKSIGFIDIDEQGKVEVYIQEV